ncbi:MAG TPA: radical SAM protein [Thermodesulfobacteriota bacterium]
MTAAERLEAAYALLDGCGVCPRGCAVRRRAGERGFCGLANEVVVARAGLHMGEEACLVGRRGTGAVYFGGCNLGCLFCQTAEISHRPAGRVMSPRALADLMLDLERRGAATIDLVTPTHVAPQVLEAVLDARARGLSRPIVYNCGGYEAVEMLRLLEGVVDVYLPDAKYADAAVAAETARIPAGAVPYPEALHAALLEMHRQVGELEVGPDGVARRGLLVRHLVMPGGLAGTADLMRFVATRLSPRTAVNLMGQYRPMAQAVGHPVLGRRPTREELDAAVAAAREAGLTRLIGLGAPPPR